MIQEQREQPNTTTSEFPSAVFGAVHRLNHVDVQRACCNGMAVRKIAGPGPGPEKPGMWQKSPIKKHDAKYIKKDELCWF